MCRIETNTKTSKIIFRLIKTLIVISFILNESEARFGDQQTLILNGRLFGHREKISGYSKDFPRIQFEELWITQPVDHFKPSDTRTFQQRYFKNATFFKPGGPAFIMLGGEGPVDPRWIVATEMMRQCEQTNCVAFTVEHRYYGKSQVLSDASVGNLAYLNIPQALADFADFVQFIRSSEEFKIEKTVLYGGSYSGSLAAYMRKYFPNIVDAASASSAPVFWTFDFLQYLEKVGWVLKQQSQTCYDMVKQAMMEIEVILDIEKLTSEPVVNTKLLPLKLCSDLDPNNEMDIQLFISGITGLFSYYTQYDNQLGFRIQDICKSLENQRNDSRKTPFEKFATTFNLMMENVDNDCIGVNNTDYCEFMSQTDYSSNAVVTGARLWNWQTCTEVGSFQTTNSLFNQPFGNKLRTELSVAQCQCSFGERYDENAIRHNIDKFMNLVGETKTEWSRTVFINGNWDPWSMMSISHKYQLFPLDKDVEVLLVKGGSHCIDMFSTSPSDSESVLKVRNETFDAILKYLNMVKINSIV